MNLYMHKLICFWFVWQHGIREKLWATWMRTCCSQYRKSITEHINCSVQFISLLVEAWQFDHCYPYCWFSSATNLTSIYIPNCLQRKHRQNRKNRPTLKVQETTMVKYRQIYVIYFWCYLVNVYNTWSPTYFGIFHGHYMLKVEDINISSMQNKQMNTKPNPI